MQKIKESAQRITSLAGAIALMLGIGASVMPAMASADALNPLTERSLMLSSAAPGFVDTDASGNTTAAGSVYALPGSGANGRQTSETYSFKVSTDSNAKNKPIKAFTLQYCTTPAGTCTAPGNDTGTAPSRGSDSVANRQSDLNVNYPSPSEVSAVPATGANVARDDSDGNFAVIVNGSISSGWTMTPDTKESTATTGKNNFVTFTNSSSTEKPTSGTQIKIIFYATDNNYVTNPGEGAFYVKINDFDTATNADVGQNDDTHALDPIWTDTDGSGNPHIIDGGVTVANVMNDSIQIQTKVLETMSFSVGTHNPDTDVLTGSDTHGDCDTITVNDPINLGLLSQEYSLSTTHTYDGFSYWRLSSNSSNGATVYYSGNTLSNTENDQIDAVGTTAAKAHPGTEQFGLAIDQNDDDTVDTAHGASIPAQGYLHPLIADDDTGPSGTNYSDGGGSINNAAWTDNTGYFAFDPNSMFTPVPIASENTDVIHCSTGKMRYEANIAPDTPAGIYTSKVNYIAAPEY